MITAQIAATHTVDSSYYQQERSLAMVPVSGRAVYLAAAASLMISGTMPGPSSVNAARAQVEAPTQVASTVDPMVLKALQWRSIGPARGGRSIAVSGVKGRPREAYFGAAGGGLWKTVDGGENWA